MLDSTLVTSVVREQQRRSQFFAEHSVGALSLERANRWQAHGSAMGLCGLVN